MANQNLSQFGENTSVSDADYTFVWDSAASISKKVSRNSWLNSGTLTSDAPVTISQTWGTTGTYTAFKVVATETLGAATASNLLELWSGSTPTLKLKVEKQGDITFLLSNRTISGAGNISLGSYTSGAYLGNLSLAGATCLMNATGVYLGQSTELAWTNGASYNTKDTILVRDGAANTLALRNGAAAQTFNVYGTYTSGSVYERMFMRYSQSALAFQVGTEQLGATSRPLEFFTNGTRKFAIAGSGINTSTFYGHDNTNSAILILRTLGGTTKAQFYVNPSGNCEFGFGFPAAGFPILLSESGNSYFNGGNVGIGTTAPGAPLHVQATASTNTRESLLKCTISDAGNAGFYVYNGTASETTYLPSFSGAAFNNALPSIFIAGLTTAAADTGSVPLVMFSARRTTSEVDPNNGTLSDIVTRPLFSWTNNYTTTHMQMAANGNLGIGTTSPTSKLHVAGNASPSITVDNTLATGASQLLFKNTVVTGDTDGIFLNGSAQSGFGGNGSLNIKATTGPIAFHTTSVTNVLSIAQNGATTFASQVNAGSFVGGGLSIAFNQLSRNSGSVISFPSNGTIQFTNNAGTDFNLLQLGGTTASFPAIKRSTVRIQAVLANDSGFTNIQGKLTTDTDYTATVVTPTGFLTLYDAQGTAYRVPCVLAP